MSPHWSNYSAGQMARKLTANGFTRVKKRGGHDFYYREDGAFAFVPMHKGRNLSRAVVRNIVKTARLTKEDMKK